MAKTYGAADWDAAASERGVIHDSIADTDFGDASQIVRGWDPNNPVKSSELVALYLLQEDSGSVAHDFGPNGDHGTVDGGVTVNQEGVLHGSGYQFDGTGDARVSLPTLAYSGDRAAMWGWFKTTTDGVEGRTVLDAQAPTLSLNFHHGGTTDRLRAVTIDSNRTSHTIATSSYDLSTWNWILYHVDFENNFHTLYVNNAQAASDTPGMASPNTISGNNNYIGAGRGGGTNYQGYVADFRVYNNTITGTERDEYWNVWNQSGRLITGAK